jgi:transcription elongation factor S-II
MASSLVDENQVKELYTSLSHASDRNDTSRVLDILTELERHTPSLSASVLKSTKIGHLAFKLREHADPAIKEKAKQLCTLWKSSFLKSAPATPQPSKRSEGHSESIKAAPAPSPPPSASPTPMESESRASNGTNRHGLTINTSADSGPSSSGSVDDIPKTKNETRNNIRKLLFEALGPPPPVAAAAQAIMSPTAADGSNKSSQAETATMLSRLNVANRAHLAAAIEEAIFSKFPLIEATNKDASHKRDLNGYRNKYAALKSNLADPNNPDLNLRLYFGIITPQQLVEMNHAELASDKMKSHRDKTQEWMAAASRSDLGKITAAVSSDYECPKCESKKCTFYQMQTRGADEPMTTFVNCLACGYQYRDGDNAHD